MHLAHRNNMHFTNSTLENTTETIQTTNKNNELNNKKKEEENDLYRKKKGESEQLPSYILCKKEGSKNSCKNCNC